MLRVMACAAALLASGALTACHTTKDSAAPDQAAHNQSTSASASTTAPAKSAPDQSETFFPTTVDSYGLDHTDTDTDNLAELYALRQIDPCGFVDQETLTAEGHNDFSYTYTAAHTVTSDGPSPTMPLGGNGCTVTVASATTGLSLEVKPGEPSWNDAQFTEDPDHPGLQKLASSCVFRVALPLSKLAGAPNSMRDPKIEVSLRNVADGGVGADDPTLCQLAEAVATSAAEHVAEQGIPAYTPDSSAAARFLTADPCAAATNLDVTGVTWNEPSPQAQSSTTWRHPGVCNLKLSGEDHASAVIRYGLAVWSDDVVESLAGDKPTASESDGITLVTIGTDSTTRCFVAAKGNDTIEPTVVGDGAPDLVASTPVVTVDLIAPAGLGCASAAQETALAAMKRAT